MPDITWINVASAFIFATIIGFSWTMGVIIANRFFSRSTS